MTQRVIGIALLALVYIYREISTVVDLRSTTAMATVAMAPPMAQMGLTVSSRHAAYLTSLASPSRTRVTVVHRPRESMENTLVL